MSEEVVGKAIAWGSMSRWPLVLLGTLAVVSPAKGQTALSASSLHLLCSPPTARSQQDRDQSDTVCAAYLLGLTDAMLGLGGAHQMKLGSVYLGGFTWTQLARALRVEEVVSRATARADAIFRVEIAPWCPEIF